MQKIGYYCKTVANKPVIGRLKDNLFVCGGLSGFGVMMSCAAGELLSNHVLGLHSRNWGSYEQIFVPYKSRVDAGSGVSLQI